VWQYGGGHSVDAVLDATPLLRFMAEFNAAWSGSQPWSRAVKGS